MRKNIKHLPQSWKANLMFSAVLTILGTGLLAAPASAGALQFYVVRPNGQTVILDMEDNENVEIIKLRIEDKTDIPIAEQLLFLDGQALDDSQTLQYYNITNGSTLELVITQDAAALNAVASPGIASNSTRLTVSGTTVGNTLYIKILNSPVTTPYTYASVEPIGNGLIAYTSGDDIPDINLDSDKYIAVYELDSSNRVISFKLVTLTANDIKPLSPVTSPTSPIITTPAPTLANTGGKFTPIMAIYSSLALIFTGIVIMHRLKQRTQKR